MSPDEYCREIETYLCRKNDGHLIRIVGPSFERVTGWAERGVPLKVAFSGIDRYFERYYSKGSRRRPVRIDFCEADVLDAFDDWRRAVGILPAAATAEADAPGHPPEAIESADEHRDSMGRGRPKTSLSAHLDRVILKLTSLRAGRHVASPLDAALERAVRELDLARSRVRSLRGEARAQLLERLDALDRDLVETARIACGPEQLTAFHSEAERDLDVFRARMPEAAYRQAVSAAVDRLVRDRAGLPTIAVD